MRKENSLAKSHHNTANANDHQQEVLNHYEHDTPKEGKRVYINDNRRQSNITVIHYHQPSGNTQRSVGFLLGLGIFFMPIIFAWFTLRKGHSNVARIIAFVWLGLMLVVSCSDLDKAKIDTVARKHPKVYVGTTAKDSMHR